MSMLLGWLCLLFLIPCSAHAEEPVELSFLLIGDWGLSGINQTIIASQMGDWAARSRSSFVVALGDNFYCKPYQFLSSFSTFFYWLHI